jgi:mono/diheme cytochrome c family protein
MHDQHKIEPLEASDFFADGQGARQLPAGVVSRDAYGEKVEPYTGLTVSGPAPEGAPPVTMALLQRGQERFNIYCSPCHDRTGSGRGMIVRRGYKQPPSYHEQRLRNAPVDYFVTVMTEGFGVMPSYREEVPLQDRWAIAYYIRALQYSQRGHLADLPAGLAPERRQAIEKDLQR